jgi:hypothetical protein
VLADVELGVARPGTGIAARRAGGTTVYWLAESVGAQLPQSAAEFRERFAAKEGEAAAPPAEPSVPAVSPPPPPGA